MHDPPLSSGGARWLLAAGVVLQSGAVSYALWRDATAFPPSTLLWWTSTGAALAVWGLAVAAVVGAARKLPALLAAVVLVPAGSLLAVGLGGRAIFTATSARLWGGVLLLGVLWMLAFARTIRAFRGRQRLALLAGVLAGAPWGMAWVLARVPSPPGTHPALKALGEPVVAAPVEGVERDGGLLRLTCGRGQLEVAPLLTFKRTSRDGFWPGASLPDRLEGPPSLDGPAARATLSVTREQDAVVVEAATELSHPVRSHLNAFTDVTVRGLVAPALSFGGRPPVAFRPFDYPRGRPVRFAWRSADGALVVMEARDAEKGPFTELDRVPLAASQALVLTLTDGATPVCKLELLDFAGQADTTPSPAAGWGVAANVVQFGLTRGPSGPQAMIHISLAETGIGLGLDTVVHAPGVYRNRLRLTPAE